MRIAAFILLNCCKRFSAELLQELLQTFFYRCIGAFLPVNYRLP